MAAPRLAPAATQPSGTHTGRPAGRQRRQRAHSQVEASEDVCLPDLALRGQVDQMGGHLQGGRQASGQAGRHHEGAKQAWPTSHSAALAGCSRRCTPGRWAASPQSSQPSLGTRTGWQTRRAGRQTAPLGAVAAAAARAAPSQGRPGQRRSGSAALGRVAGDGEFEWRLEIGGWRAVQGSGAVAGAHG